MSYFNNTEEVEDVGEAVYRRPLPMQFQQQSYVPARPRPGAPTNQQVNTAFDKVAADVRVLSAQVKEIEQRVETTQSRNTKALTAVRSDLGQTKMISALLPLLSRPETKEVAADVKVGDTTVFAKGEKVVESGDDTLSTILPLLLLMGPSTDGTGTGAQGIFGGDNSMMMMLVLAFALRKKS